MGLLPFRQTNSDNHGKRWGPKGLGVQGGFGLMGRVMLTHVMWAEKPFKGAESKVHGAIEQAARVVGLLLLFCHNKKN